MDYSKINSYEAACADQGRDPSLKPDVSKLEPGLQKFLMSAFELAIITKSLNKDEQGNYKKAIWNDSDHWNHFPYWSVLTNKKNTSGSGLSLSVVGSDCSFASVAARLTTREEEASQYSAETFKDKWEDFILERD